MKKNDKLDKTTPEKECHSLISLLRAPLRKPLESRAVIITA